MEQVLGVYTRPYDAAHPVICMDETTKQCVREVRTPLPTVPGHPARYDAEYERNGVGHLLMYYAPFDDHRHPSEALAPRNDDTLQTRTSDVVLENIADFGSDYLRMKRPLGSHYLRMSAH